MSLEIPCKEDYAQATSAFIQEDYPKALEFYRKSLTIVNEIQVKEWVDKYILLGKQV